MSHPPSAPAFDLAAILASHERQELPLLETHINPAFAKVLKTIGFDVRYVRGQGAYLYAENGDRYIDCLGGYAVFNVGRNHPTVRDALKQAMDLDLPNLPGVGPFRTAGILAEELLRVTPGRGEAGAPDTIYFCNSGAEAVEAAIKFARCATGRDGVVYCHRSYHGLTMGALSCNGNHEFREPFGTLLAGTTEIPFNDLAALELALSKKNVAAFIVEPIQGKGVNIPADNYLKEAQALCHKYGSVLIADEIQTGMGRTGRMFACDHWDVVPDIMVIGKGLSGGYIPVAATIAKRWIHEKVFSTMDRCSVQQTTFGMNDLAMVAGLATLHVLREEKIIEHTAAVGEHLMSGLRKMVGKYQMVKEVRGKGLMVAIEFQAPTSLGLKMGWNLLHKLDQSLFCQAVLMPLIADHRVLAQVAGHRLDVIKLIPPLVLSTHDADEIAAAFDVTVGACHQFPGPAWEVGKKLSAAAVKRFSTAKPVGAGS